MARPKGIAIALAEAGDEAPSLSPQPGGWSRQAVLEWLLTETARGDDLLIGMDLSPAFPFDDEHAYFPDLHDTPADARALWAQVERLCADEPHFSASGFAREESIARHFRRQEGQATITGDLFRGGAGRLRKVERVLVERRHGQPASCFNLVGAKQIGKSSLTGMRLLHALAGAIPIWPFDEVPPSGPVIVEIYTGIVARAAGLPPSRTKVRDGDTLNRALNALGSQPHAPLPRYDDHATDAILTAAWLRRAAADPALWSPPALTPALARTEGWTFGVP